MRENFYSLVLAVIIVVTTLFFNITLEADGWVQFKAPNSGPGRNLYVKASRAIEGQRIFAGNIYKMFFDGAGVVSKRFSRPSTAPSYRIPFRVTPEGISPDKIDEISVRNGIHPPLTHAIIQVESGGNPMARSRENSKGRGRAMGMMQLLPSTARRFNVNDPYDPEENIDGGTRYLKELLDEFKEVELALAGYNAGEGAVRKHGGIPPYLETQRYVKSVMDILTANQP
jgi:hypothetical protein